MSNKHRGCTRRRQRLQQPDNKLPRDRRVVTGLRGAAPELFPRVSRDRVEQLLLEQRLLGCQDEAGG